MPWYVCVLPSTAEPRSSWPRRVYPARRLTSSAVVARRWLESQGLTPVHRLLVDLLTRQADALKQEIGSLEGTLREVLGGDPALDRLLKVPGFGFLTAATFLAEVGDVSRFPRARNVVSYLGLAPRVHASGGRVRMGGLPRKDLPWSVLISCKRPTTPSVAPAYVKICMSVCMLGLGHKQHGWL